VIFGYISICFALLLQPDLVIGLRSVLSGFHPPSPAVVVFPAQRFFSCSLVLLREVIKRTFIPFSVRQGPDSVLAHGACSRG
jgi:hypothetical protein